MKKLRLENREWTPEVLSVAQNSLDEVRGMMVKSDDKSLKQIEKDLIDVIRWIVSEEPSWKTS